MRVACRLRPRVRGGRALRLTLAGLLFALPVALPADGGLRTALSEGLAALESAAPPGMVVALGTFTYADKKIGSPFSRLLESESAFLIAQRSHFQLFARDRLEEILEAAELSLSDLTDPDSRIEIGRLESIQGLLSGRFFDEGTQVRVFLELVEVERGTVLGAASLAIDKGLLPAGVSVLPGNYQDALGVLEELAQVENAGNEEFVVKVWTPRGDGGTYLDGERLVVHFFSNRDCYIKLYHVDVGPNLQLIFPNEYYRDNFVQARRIYRIPDERYPFAFVLGSPYGTEFIKVIASTVQFRDIERSFESLGAPSRGVIKRGLRVTQTGEQVTETMISYTILPK